MSRFLPTSAKEVEALGWDYIDVILFSGDAYIDPSFGIAVIGRLLEAEGYRVVPGCFFKKVLTKNNIECTVVLTQ